MAFDQTILTGTDENPACTKHLPGNGVARRCLKAMDENRNDQALAACERYTEISAEPDPEVLRLKRRLARHALPVWRS